MLSLFVALLELYIYIFRFDKIISKYFKTHPMQILVTITAINQEQKC